MDSFIDPVLDLALYDIMLREKGLAYDCEGHTEPVCDDDRCQLLEILIRLDIVTAT